MRISDWSSDVCSSDLNKQVLDYLGTPSVTVVSWSGGTNNAVRVSAQTQRDLPFSSLFLPAGPTITATATAAVIDSGEFCMLATNETAQAAVSIGGNALLQLGCGIATNSNPSRSEEHTSDIQSLMRISYADFCF